MKKNMINQLDKEGWCHGPWSVYYDNGQLLCKGEFKNGNRRGLWEDYWSDGQISSKGEYKKGKDIGLWYYSGYA